MDMSWLRQPQISIHNDVCIQVQHPRCLLALLAFLAKLLFCERNQHAQFTQVNAGQACMMHGAMSNRNEVAKQHTSEAILLSCPTSCTAPSM